MPIARRWLPRTPCPHAAPRMTRESVAPRPAHPLRTGDLLDGRSLADGNRFGDLVAAAPSIDLTERADSREASRCRPKRRTGRYVRPRWRVGSAQRRLIE